MPCIVSLCWGFSEKDFEQVLNVKDAWIDLRSLNFVAVRSLIGFNVSNLLDTINYILFMQGPAFLLRSNMSLVGLYGIGLQVNNLIRSCFMSVYSAMSPVTVSLYSLGNIKLLQSMFCIAMKAFTSAAMMIWIWFWLLGTEALEIWFSDKVNIGELLVALPYIIAASAIGIMAMTCAAVAIALERHRFPALIGFILAGTAFFINSLVLQSQTDHFLTKITSLVAVGLALDHIVRLVIVSHALKLTLIVGLLNLVVRPALPAIASGALLWIGQNLVLAPTILHIILLTLAAGAVYVIVLWNMVYNPSEKEKILSIMPRRVHTACS